MEELNLQPLKTEIRRGTLCEVHIADIHFGAMDPAIEYNILLEQFIKKIDRIAKLDIIGIDGDIFDHKMMANSPAIYYAIKFVGDVVEVAKYHNAAVIMTVGTPSHEANQYGVLSQYVQDPEAEVYIMDHIGYVYTHGAKILCIPELHGEDEKVYQKYLYQEYCDQVFGHMTIKGAVYGDNVATGRLFVKEDFLRSRGPILSGHVHKPGCFERDFYYTGSPMRYKFGEEEAKGFLIVLFDLDTRMYNVHFEEISSFKYTTIELTEVAKDPREIINYIDGFKTRNNIDNLKIKFECIVDPACKTVVTNYYRNKSNIKLEFMDSQQAILAKSMQEHVEANQQYNFITDHKLTAEEKFCMYANLKEGMNFINVAQLNSILNTEI